MCVRTCKRVGLVRLLVMLDVYMLVRTHLVLAGVCGVCDVYIGTSGPQSYVIIVFVTTVNTCTK